MTTSKKKMAKKTDKSASTAPGQWLQDRGRGTAVQFQLDYALAGTLGSEKVEHTVASVSEILASRIMFYEARVDELGNALSTKALANTKLSTFEVHRLQANYRLCRSIVYELELIRAALETGHMPLDDADPLLVRNV